MWTPRTPGMLAGILQALLAALLVLPLLVDAQRQQHFRVTPSNTRVIGGQEARLLCEVDNLAGAVQWTKDGFALGYTSVIPGFPRYAMRGDASRGIFNLHIYNASYEDDAEFQCQVSPSGKSAAIRANASLTVLYPPSAIEISNHTDSGKIQIKANEDLQLECRVRESKPAASIVWYRGDVELKMDKRDDSTTEVTVPGRGSRASRFVVASKIRLKPTPEDDGLEYTCEARHEAIDPRRPMRATVQLSVLYPPPGPPFIEGYIDGETIQRGQTVELVCKSRGGNPLAQLIWYKNDEPVTMTYHTADHISQSTYKFKAEPSDNKARYRCSASNVMSAAPLSAQVQLLVHFPPTKVVITGSSEARVGDVVPLTCKSTNSNPPTEIKWTVDGRQVMNATSRTVPSEDGGFITISNVTTEIPPGVRSVVVVCHGLHIENIAGTHTINVQYPPGPPIIHGHKQGTTIAAGTKLRLACISSGGNPVANLTWFKNDKRISSASKFQDTSVSSEIDIITNATDNEARYKCEASNGATEYPLSEEIKLSVLFPPDKVQIKKEPAILRPGQTATLTCDSSSSNPPAVLTWWRDGITVENGITNSSSKGLHGGTVSTVKVSLSVSPGLNGVVYTCQASNEVLQRSAHDAITLDVLYKPVFENDGSEALIGSEGQPIVVALQPHGNPSNMTFIWSKDGRVIGQPSETQSRVFIDGPVLNISALHKEDTGIYTCEANNSEGSSSISVNITVQYPARIKSVSASTLVSPGEEAQLNCTAEGNPLKAEHITWRREGYESLESKSSMMFRNNTSFLTIHKATKEDIGAFICVVNNGLGNETTAPAYLLVKHKPEVDSSPVFGKAAANVGDTAKLICRAKGAPDIQFNWTREGSTIPVNLTKKYLVDYHKIDYLTFESVLLVRNVEQKDFGKYQCTARNTIDFVTHSVKLDITSKPDIPTQLTSLNSTHNSVTLSWIPGFDGGLPTTFRIRYKPSGSANDAYQYADVVPSNATTFTIRNLDLATEYVFTVMAMNKQGHSDYGVNTKGQTTNEAPPPVPASSNMPQSSWIVVLVAVGGIVFVIINIVLISCCLRKHTRKRLTGGAEMLSEELLGRADLPRLVIVSVAITGSILLLLNITLVGCFMYRKRRRRLREASEQSSSKSATIEMYAPSSYNETVTGETLSSVSEKSESYSNADSNPDFLVRKQEDGRKTAASTYLIDQIDYPFQYPGYEMQHQLPHSHPPHTHQHHLTNTLKAPHTESVTTVNSGTLRKHQPSYNNHSIGGVQPGGDTFYGISPDARYMAYPPPAEFSQPTGNGTLRRGQLLSSVGQGPVGVPPDVTVLHNPPIPPPPLLSTFSYPAAMETEGHLV